MNFCACDAHRIKKSRRWQLETDRIYWRIRETPEAAYLCLFIEVMQPEKSDIIHRETFFFCRFVSSDNVSRVVSHIYVQVKPILSCTGWWRCSTVSYRIVGVGTNNNRQLNKQISDFNISLWLCTTTTAKITTTATKCHNISHWFIRCFVRATRVLWFACDSPTDTSKHEQSFILI